MRISNMLALVSVGAVGFHPVSSHAFLDVLLNPATVQAAMQAGQAAGAAQAAAQAPQTAAQQAATAQACAASKGMAAGCAAVPAMTFSRPPDQLDKLFTGEPLSGDQLMTEVRTLRSAIASNSLNTAMASLLGPIGVPGAPQPAAAGGLFSGGGFFSSIAGSAADMVLDMLVAELSYQALDTFFSSMTDQPGLLKEVQITLPKPDALMTPEVKQQLVTMASFLVAIKASGKIIDASEKDFDEAKASYSKVLESRSKAAKLLGDAFYAKSGLFASQQESAARGQDLLSASDREYLEAFRDKKPEDLIRDFNAQNIALDYLRKSNPAEYANYRVGVDEFKSHYGAYTRTALGATSMVAFSALFLKRAKSMLEKSGLAAAPSLLPILGDGLTELTTLAPRVKKTIERAPDTQDGSFSVKLGNGEFKRELSAGKVFETMSEAGRGNFQTALFKNGQAGYFGQLGEKYPLVAGRILDHLVEKDHRKEFVKGYLGEDDLPDFSFQNSLSDNARKTRELKAALFRSAPGGDAVNEDEKAIAVVQKDVRDNLGKWDNSTLRRIVFANRDPNKQGSELALADVTIGVDSPGMKGIMEYEEMAIAGVEHAVVRNKKESDPPAASGENAKTKASAGAKAPAKAKKK